METHVAKVISFVFHPLLMPSYGLLLFFYLDKYTSYFLPFELKRTLFLMTVCFTFLLPAINALILLRMRVIRSLHMETRQERRIPLLITAIFYFAEYYLLNQAESPATLQLLMLSAIISIMLTIFINVFWKISVHMIGIGAVTGMSVLLSVVFKQPQFLLVSVLFLTAGIIAYARLQLKAHSPAEVYAGFLLGFLCHMVFLL